jgi:hypothetical protein
MKRITISFPTEEARSKFLDDLNALVDYCTDDSEFKDFDEYVSDSERYSDEGWDRLINSSNHVYARACRIGDVLVKVKR